MRRDELQLQRAIAQLLDAALCEPAVWTTFPAGGGGRVRGAILNGAGLKAGWPDIQIVYRCRYYGLELKSARGELSPAQRAMFDRLARAGGMVAVVRSLDEAIAKLQEWRIPLRLAVRPANSIPHSGAAA